MVKRHYGEPFRFICFTDDPAGISPEIEALPIWDDHASVPNPTGGGRPSCYRRLKLFDPGMKEVLGERFVMLDLDTVVCGNLSALWNRPEPIVMWKSPTNQWRFNGAMFMADTGARPDVWTDFDPIESPKLTTSLGFRGSDQAWLSYKLPQGEAEWTQKDGVYYYGSMANRRVLPKNAKIVFTTGGSAPWTLKHPWVRQHYR
jgi:hypothetical protein